MSMICQRCALRKVQPFLSFYGAGVLNGKNIFRNKSVTTLDDNEHDPDKPIRFSTSRAAQWKANYKGLKGQEETEPPESRNKKLSLLICYAILVLYAFNREGNEWDEEMDMPLGKRLLLLQEYHINEERANRKPNEDMSDLNEELSKIIALKKRYNYD